MRIFRKLVRDRIPEIIEADGKRPVVRVLDQAEYRQALSAKLLEEVQEYRTGAAEPKTELADILEVIDAIIAAEGFSKKDIAAIQERKRAERGGFSRRLFLEGTEE